MMSTAFVSFSKRVTQRPLKIIHRRMGCHMQHRYNGHTHLHDKTSEVECVAGIYYCNIWRKERLYILSVNRGPADVYNVNAKEMKNSGEGGRGGMPQ